MVILTEFSGQKSIVLIGPTGVGKTAVGQKLSALLDWNLVELDELRSAWYPEFGLDAEGEREAGERGGLPELVATWKPYELMSVERVVAEHLTRTVIAFGGGQSVYDDDDMIQRASTALSQVGRVILLLPSEHGDESMVVLHERLRSVPFVTKQENPESFLRAFTPILKMQLLSESNRQLATEMIVTGHSTPEEIARHIATTMDRE